jgi:hypothetical protein
MYFIRSRQRSRSVDRTVILAGKGEQQRPSSRQINISCYQLSRPKKNLLINFSSLTSGNDTNCCATYKNKKPRLNALYFENINLDLFKKLNV